MNEDNFRDDRMEEVAVVEQGVAKISKTEMKKTSSVLLYKCMHTRSEQALLCHCRSRESL